jgi:hypothetical protein
MFISKKNAIAFGAIGVAILVLVAFIATNLVLGHRKKVEDQRLALLVADATGQLRQALGPGPSGASVARIEEYLQGAKASPNADLGSAAEYYLLGAREIARRRAESQRLTQEAAAARAALARHMSRADHRNTTWIRDAAELKRRVELSHADLGRALKTLDDLLNNLPAAEKRLVPHIAPSAMLEAGEIDAARKRTQAEAQRAVAELEQVRRIVP